VSALIIYICDYARELVHRKRQKSDVGGAPPGMLDRRGRLLRESAKKKAPVTISAGPGTRRKERDQNVPSLRGVPWEGRNTALRHYMPSKVPSSNSHWFQSKFSHRAGLQQRLTPPRNCLGLSRISDLLALTCLSQPKCVSSKPKPNGSSANLVRCRARSVGQNLVVSKRRIGCLVPQR
jgi:hypothetical protein